MSATDYNRRFAWRNDFGGGLAPAASCGNPFAGLDPGGTTFEVATRVFQADHRLKADGFFGPDTFERYKKVYGEPTLCAHGTDVSGWQLEDDLIVEDDDDEEVHFDKLLEQGLTFTHIKLKQGRGVVTRRFRAHYANAGRARVLRGPYDFVMPREGGREARVQAEHYMTLIEAECADHELRACMDLEDKGYRKDDDGRITRGEDMYRLWKTDRAEYRKWMTDWSVSYIERFTALYGCRPLLYSYPSFLRSRIDLVEVILDCPLWLAAYTLEDPREVYDIDPRFELVSQQVTSSGNAKSKKVYSKNLDINRAPWGVGALLRP